MCDNCTRTAMRLLALAFSNLAVTMASGDQPNPDTALCRQIGQVMALGHPPEVDRNDPTWDEVSGRTFEELQRYLASISDNDAVHRLASVLDDMEDIFGALRQVVTGEIKRRAAAGDADAASRLAPVPIDVHVIDLDAIMRAKREAASAPEYRH